MNHVALKGRLTKDIELRQTNGGDSVCSFNLAVDRRFKNRDGERKADFITCQAWKQTAEFISKYFSKGQEMIVEGNLQVRDWEDKDGNKRVSTEVVVENVEFCGPSPGQSQKSAASDHTPAPKPKAQPDDDEDMPF